MRIAPYHSSRGCVTHTNAAVYVSASGGKRNALCQRRKREKQIASRPRLRFDHYSRILYSSISRSFSRYDRLFFRLFHACFVGPKTRPAGHDVRKNTVVFRHANVSEGPSPELEYERTERTENAEFARTTRTRSNVQKNDGKPGHGCLEC